MKLVDSTLKKVDLRAAVELEAASDRNLIPPEPGWDVLASKAAEVAAFIREEAKAGRPVSPATEIAARKAGHGVRPIAYVGVAERVLYRALASAAVSRAPAMDRSPDAYLRFVKAPIDFSFAEQKAESGSDSQLAAGKSLLFSWLESPYKYVVKSDITAFYQYVDHGLLAEELILGGGDADVVDAVVGLLAGTQGKGYGLPQLLDGSDWLSEVYADRLERQLLREGLAVWRFNDDFRIACRTYSDTLNAVEALDRAARSMGLILNENKTISIKFANYFLDAIGKTEQQVNDTISPDEVEEIVSDYTEDFESDPEAALRLLADASPRDGSRPDLRSLRSDDYRLLRRAIAGLAATQHAGGLQHLPRIIRYAPALTPAACKYLVRVGQPAGAEVFETLLALSKDASTSEWQRLWLTDTAQAVSANGSSDAISRLKAWRSEAKSPVARAAISSALLTVGGLTAGEVSDEARWAPPACFAYYASAFRQATAAGVVSQSDAVVQAFRRESVLHRLVVDP